MKWLRKLLHSDRRRAIRWDTECLVAYYWDGSTPTPHRIVNVSFSGFRLETTGRWQRGTLITMTLQKAGVRGNRVRPDDYIVLISRVAWSNGEIAGLEFIPREYAGKADVPCVGSPATKRGILEFLERCHPERTPPKMCFSPQVIASEARR